MGHRQRVTHRHGGIYRVTALFQNINAHAGRGGIHRRHHSLLLAHRVEGIGFNAVGDGGRFRLWRGGHAKTASSDQRRNSGPARKLRLTHHYSPGKMADIAA